MELEEHPLLKQMAEPSYKHDLRKMAEVAVAYFAQTASFQATVDEWSNQRHECYQSGMIKAVGCEDADFAVTQVIDAEDHIEENDDEFFEEVIEAEQAKGTLLGGILDYLI